MMKRDLLRLKSVFCLHETCYFVNLLWLSLTNELADLNIKQ